MSYETYVDAQQCKRAKCVQPGVSCPTEEQMRDQALGCQADGKAAEKFWNGLCTVMRCLDASVCPTEQDNGTAIAKCKAVGKDYRYFQRGNCNVVECDTTVACPSNSKLELDARQCNAKGMDFRYVDDGQCRRVECTDSECQETPGFRTAQWSCQDGFEQRQGDPSSCKPSETWRRYAEDNCKGRCNPQTGKCGVNSYSVDWECGGVTACANPSQTCPSMEANERIARECTNKGGTPTKAWDAKNCLRISCEHAEPLAEDGRECAALRGKIDTVCTDKSRAEEACTDARETFAEQCLRTATASACLNAAGEGSCGNGSEADAKAVQDWCWQMSNLLDAEYARSEYSDEEKAKFYAVCFAGNGYRAESAECKHLRSALVVLKNKGLTSTADFKRMASAFEDACAQSGVPAAAHDEDVLDEDACEDYGNPYPDTAYCSLEGRAATELYRRDIATGMPSGEFEGDAPLNRAQAAKFLLRACNLSELPVSQHAFPDVDESQWYAPLIHAAVAEGVLYGNPDGTMRPGNTVNHAEFATMLMRACDIQPEGWLVCAQDVKPNDWFAPAAAVAQAYELYPGTLVFNATAKQTRAETAVAIYQYLKHREDAPVPDARSACFLLPSTSDSTDADTQFGVGIE